MHVVLLVVQGYSLSRLGDLQPKARPGLAVIPVPVDRLLAPGQRARMHIYDTSSLEALSHAQAHANGTYGQVVIDEVALAERRFALEPIGSRVQVLSVQPSTHTDKFGGSSQSVLADVIGVGILEPGSVLEKMPFMTVECAAAADALCEPLDAAVAPAMEAKLVEHAALCQSLEGVASFNGPLTRAAAQQQGGEWSSLDDCVGRVVSLRGAAAAACDGSRLVLSALAASQHLPGRVRADAMRLAQQGCAGEAVDLVATALEEESRRRLAMKALKGLAAE